MTEESIFAAAIEMESREERAAFVRRECGDDEELRAQVEALLAAHDNPDSVFERPCVGQVQPDGGEIEHVSGEATDGEVPRRLGDFDVLGEIGRGGMGVVYEARQRSLNRKVALKVLSSGLGLTTKAVMRFRREAEAAAKLHHTNIVPIYSTGEDRGVHFYAMELITGPSLDQVIRHLRGEESRRLETGGGRKILVRLPVSGLPPRDLCPIGSMRRSRSNGRRATREQRRSRRVALRWAMPTRRERRRACRAERITSMPSPR